MTEVEWLECTNPRPMLEFLRGTASERRYYLFGIACARSVWHLLSDGCIDAVAITERYAEKKAKFRERQLVESAPPIMGKILGVYLTSDAVEFAHHCSELGQYRSAQDALRRDQGANYDEQIAAESKAQSQLLRCVFNSPLQKATIDPRWQTSTVVDLARSIYQERVYDRMPILADALMDAGCDNDEILNHCHQTGEHVRGCWVVDLLTGRT